MSRKKLLLFTALLVFCSQHSVGQSKGESSAELKKLSIEELMNIEVTLVSRSPQKLQDAASAVQIITSEDIRNSGAANIAEALRLVSNLQVAQLNSQAWLIGSRGFNTVFANKLLVMIDGRTVYSALFAGVFYNMQNVLLEDVERIEVVSGPGGTLWGANAVNGVINIVTKSSKDTKGLYASALAGTFIKDQFGLRYGGTLGGKINYRVYGQHFDRNNSFLPDGSKFFDAWNLTQAGMRMDWQDGKNNNYVVQGDYSFGVIKSKGPSHFNEQNILGRWTRDFDEKRNLSFQFYLDHFYQGDGTTNSSDEATTIDGDFQYRFPLANHHSILTGLGYRLVNDHFAAHSGVFAILPETRRLDLLNAFIQDEITLSDKLKLTAGTKLIHTVYTGFELQPGLRLGFTVNKTNSLWAAVSRAVRTPSRLDVDYYTPPPPQPATVPQLAGGPNYQSEKAIAYELGYRVQPNEHSSLSLSTFYTSYDDIYSLEKLPGTAILQTSNGSEGNALGAELSGTYGLSDKWRIRAGYTYVDMNLKAKPGHVFDPSYLSNDARNQVMLQSMTDLGDRLHFDIIARYLDHLPQTLATISVPAYFTFDARIAYRYKFAEISVVGQNINADRHREFSNKSIPRGIYSKLTVRL